MCPMINQDFSGIKSNATFEAIPQNEYRLRIVGKPEHGETNKNKLPQVMFELEVIEGEHEGAKVFDYVVLQDTKGKPSKIGLGRLKAYAEAILGEDAANSTEGFDTDDLEDGVVRAEVSVESYDKENADGTKETRTTNRIKKVFPDS